MENEQKVYLTFDEGYENGYTSNILDTLKEKNVKAVFFVTLSYAKKNPTLIRRMIDEGHIVGNHSYKHYSYPEDTIQAAYDDLISLHKYMVDEYNYEMKLFRFPMGQYSERMLCLLDKLGYESVFWSFAYADWDEDNQPEPSVAKEKIVSNVHPGALYLLHAVSKTNTEVLAEVIDDIRALGYTFEEYPVS
jgi:peptidoglycan-N-acetylmuramic acid deacetylase